MTLVLTLLTIVVAALAVAVALGRIGGGMQAPVSYLPPVRLPDGPLHSSDLDELRFAPALRGYRMDEVDAVLARLREELARRDDLENAQLEQIEFQADRDAVDFDQNGFADSDLSQDDIVEEYDVIDYAEPDEPSHFTEHRYEAPETDPRRS